MYLPKSQRLLENPTLEPKYLGSKCNIFLASVEN